MKKQPVTIHDLDVQPISDEELKAFGEHVAGAESSYAECCNDSNDWIIVICGAS